MMGWCILPVLSVRGASKMYGHGRVSALESVDLDVEEGEVLALIGPNGSGKSTLLRIMATLQKPDAGRVLLFGLKGGPEARRKVGYLFDHSSTGRTSPATRTPGSSPDPTAYRQRRLQRAWMISSPGQCSMREGTMPWPPIRSA